VSVVFGLGFEACDLAATSIIGFDGSPQALVTEYAGIAIHRFGGVGLVRQEVTRRVSFDGEAPVEVVRDTLPRSGISASFGRQRSVNGIANHTLSGVPSLTRFDVALAIQVNAAAPTSAVASTPKLAMEVCVHMPKAGTSHASKEVTGMAKVNATAAHNKWMAACAAPRKNAQARAEKKAA